MLHPVLSVDERVRLGSRFTTSVDDWRQLTKQFPARPAVVLEHDNGPVVTGVEKQISIQLAQSRDALGTYIRNNENAWDWSSSRWKR